MQYNTVKHNTPQHRTAQHKTIKCNTNMIQAPSGRKYRSWRSSKGLDSQPCVWTIASQAGWRCVNFHKWCLTTQKQKPIIWGSDVFLSLRYKAWRLIMPAAWGAKQLCTWQQDIKTGVFGGVNSRDFPTTASSNAPIDSRQKSAQGYQSTFPLSCRQSLLSSPKFMFWLHTVWLI